MNLLRFAGLAGLLLATTALFGAESAPPSVVGVWKATFPSQQGGPDQSITFTFKEVAGKLTGTALSTATGEQPVGNIKLEKDAISFTQTLDFQGMPFTLTFNGKISAEKLDLKMTIADFNFSQDLTAMRVKETPAAAAPAPAPAPAAKK